MIERVFISPPYRAGRRCRLGGGVPPGGLAQPGDQRGLARGLGRCASVGAWGGGVVKLISWDARAAIGLGPDTTAGSLCRVSIFPLPHCMTAKILLITRLFLPLRLSNTISRSCLRLILH